MTKKVVVSGMNMMNAVGMNLKESWGNLVAGKSGIDKISLYDPAESITKIAGELPEDFDSYAKTYCKNRLAKQMTRATKMSYVCAKEAVETSGVNFDDYDRLRCGVIQGIIGTGNSSIDQKKSPDSRIIKNMNNAMAAWISLAYKLEGPSYAVTTACSSSAYAIAHAYDSIQMNKCDLVIVGGGSSIINPDEIGGFNQIHALSVANDNPQKASRPFSVDRDGFVMGEGAGIMILESEESAKARNAEIHAELKGYALTTEAYNIMSPMKEGTGMAKTMNLALDHSGVNKEEVGYINAHGTSTQLNDKYETLGIKQVFKENAANVAVSSTKSMIGHTMGASAVIEAIVSVMSIKNNILTPTINYNADPELDLDYVPNQAREQKVDVCLSNSFAFGGHNATLVFKRYEA